MRGLMFPKPRPSALEKADRRAALEAQDEKESKLVRERSNGQCEVLELGVIRCQRRAFHLHHRMGGHGVRGRGASALAVNKLHVCDQCHREIHAHILVPDGDTFRRLR
jgi:hypothetical protein